MSHFQTFYARCPYHKRRCKCAERTKADLALASPEHVQILETREMRLAKRFIASLQVHSTERLSSTLIPARIGHSRDVDNAVLATIQARHVARMGIPMGSIYYQRSLNALQRACSSINVTEETLMIATQCSLYEIITMPGNIPVFRHAEGIAAMYRSRTPSEWQEFEYARTLLYESWFMVLYNPMLRGVPSLFDDGQAWASLLPAPQQMSLPETAKLRMLSLAMFIKLPRLIAQVRAMNSTDHAQNLTTQKAMQLATPLLGLVDKTSEEKLIYTVCTRKMTEAASFSWHIPMSHGFPRYADAAGAVYYWSARLMLIRLCSVIAVRAHPSLLENFPALREIYQERERLLMLILKSLDFSWTLSPLGQSPYFLAIPIIHGAVIESEQISTEDKFRLGHALVTSWQHMTGGVIPKYHDSVLKMISKVMIGGPLPRADDGT